VEADFGRFNSIPSHILLIIQDLIFKKEHDKEYSVNIQNIFTKNYRKENKKKLLIASCLLLATPQHVLIPLRFLMACIEASSAGVRFSHVRLSFGNTLQTSPCVSVDLANKPL
jgi:hypothetical protein